MLKRSHHEVRNHLKVTNVLGDHLTAVVQRRGSDQQIRKGNDDTSETLLSGDRACPRSNLISEWLNLHGGAKVL